MKPARRAVSTITRRKFLSIGGIAFLAAASAYLLSMGFWLRWQEKAATLEECQRRVRITQNVYAPIVWLERVDPTRTVEKIVGGYASLWHDPSFHPDKLPP